MNSMYNTVFLNGKPLNCLTKMSLYDLLVYHQFNINSIVVEYNKRIISKDALTGIVLKAQDNIEVITIVGGG